MISTGAAGRKAGDTHVRGSCSVGDAAKREGDPAEMEEHTSSVCLLCCSMLLLPLLLASAQLNSILLSHAMLIMPLLIITILNYCRCWTPCVMHAGICLSMNEFISLFLCPRKGW